MAHSLFYSPAQFPACYISPIGPQAVSNNKDELLYAHKHNPLRLPANCTCELLTDMVYAMHSVQYALTCTNDALSLTCVEDHISARNTSVSSTGMFLSNFPNGGPLSCALRFIPIW